MGITIRLEVEEGDDPGGEFGDEGGYDVGVGVCVPVVGGGCG